MIDVENLNLLKTDSKEDVLEAYYPEIGIIPLKRFFGGEKYEAISTCCGTIQPIHKAGIKSRIDRRKKK